MPDQEEEVGSIGEETISCNLAEFKEQVKQYERLAVVVVGEHSEAIEQWAQKLQLSELAGDSLSDVKLTTTVLVAEGKCEELAIDYLKVKRAPTVVVLERGVKKGEVELKGDFEKEMAALRELCR
jgi:hypothetical protein